MFWPACLVLGGVIAVVDEAARWVSRVLDVVGPDRRAHEGGLVLHVVGHAGDPFAVIRVDLEQLDRARPHRRRHLLPGNRRDHHVALFVPGMGAARTPRDAAQRRSSPQASSGMSWLCLPRRPSCPDSICTHGISITSRVRCAGCSRGKLHGVSQLTRGGRIVATDDSDCARALPARHSRPSAGTPRRQKGERHEAHDRHACIAGVRRRGRRAGPLRHPATRRDERRAEEAARDDRVRSARGRTTAATR